MTRPALALLALAGCQHWTKGDTARELGFAAVTSADWYQTEAIARDCQEVNPIVGPCGGTMGPGTGAPVDAVMPVMLLAHAAVSAMLPPSWRRAWQWGGIGAEGATVVENYWSGFGFRGWSAGWHVR